MDITNEWKKLGRFCKSVIIVLGFVGLIRECGSSSVGPNASVHVDGNSAQITVRSESGYKLETVAYSGLQAVYVTAKKHPEVKQITVTFTISGEGLIDRYGNKVADYEMGQVEFDGNEVRRYVEDYAFTQGDQDVALQFRIRSMRGSHFLK